MTTVLDEGIHHASLPRRVWGLIRHPRREWTPIAQEAEGGRSLFFRYVLPLSALGPLCSLVGGLVFGLPAGARVFPPDPAAAVFAALAALLLNLLTVQLTTLAVDAMTPLFGGEPDRSRAFRLTAYALTPVWLAGAVAIYPPAWILGVVGLYGVYLLYCGVRALMPARRGKSLLFTLAIAAAALIPLSLAGVIPAAIARINLIPKPGEASRWEGRRFELPGIAGERTRIQALLQEDAVKASGFAADRRRAPVSADELSALLPDALPGDFTRARVEGASGTANGVKAARVSADFTAPKATITLEILDMGPAGGVAAGLGPTANTETAGGYAKVGLVDGRLTSERYDRQTYSGSYGVIVAGRFAVRADGQHVIVNDLKTAVRAVDFERLEALAKG